MTDITNPAELAAPGSVDLAELTSAYSARLAEWNELAADFDSTAAETASLLSLLPPGRRRKVASQRAAKFAVAVRAIEQARLDLLPVGVQIRWKGLELAELPAWPASSAAFVTAASNGKTALANALLAAAHAVWQSQRHTCAKATPQALHSEGIRLAGSEAAHRAPIFRPSPAGLDARSMPTAMLPDRTR